MNVRGDLNLPELSMKTPELDCDLYRRLSEDLVKSVDREKERVVKKKYLSACHSYVS